MVHRQVGIVALAHSRNSDAQHYCFRCISGGDCWQPNLVFDDGGDMTHVLLKKFPALSGTLKGIVEETITGVHRLYQRCKQTGKAKQLPCAAMNTHDAVTKASCENT